MSFIPDWKLTKILDALDRADNLLGNVMMRDDKSALEKHIASLQTVRIAIDDAKSHLDGRD
jgi:hypothetical protein